MNLMAHGSPSGFFFVTNFRIVSQQWRASLASPDGGVRPYTAPFKNPAWFRLSAWAVTSVWILAGRLSPFQPAWIWAD